jgi:hypothetical protein
MKEGNGFGEIHSIANADAIQNVAEITVKSIVGNRS